ncbi:MAG: DUF5758 domain-containing protein [Eubacterium sp.]
MQREEFECILTEHNRWLCDKDNCTRADLRDADLRGANLETVFFNETTSFLEMQCPEKGAFVGWKVGEQSEIIELLITEDAKRSSATSRKCRCSKAKVLSIISEDGEELKKAVSKRDENFIYIVGETVEVENFDDDRWNECSTGIHFFITKEEAINYGY